VTISDLGAGVFYTDLRGSGYNPPSMLVPGAPLAARRKDAADRSPMTSAKDAPLIDSLDEIDEFEREPVPPDKVKGFKSFLGMVAGEHIAGTEFVIGPLFVIHGAGARDVFLGLLVGNILATLSWTLICAPTAVKTRLTIFFQLEKISGRSLVASYTTALAWFPAIVSKLDQFLGIYALIGIPVGAIVLVDVYLFRRLGLTPNLAAVTGSRFNAAVALAWIAAIVFGYALFRYTEADFFFFMALPGWFVAAILYVVLSAVLQKRRAAPAPEAA